MSSEFSDSPPGEGDAELLDNDPRAAQQGLAADNKQLGVLGFGSILASGLLRHGADGQRCLLQLKPSPLGGRARRVLKIEFAESDAEILACFPVMQSLRTLGDATSFLRRVRSQQLSGYRLAALTDGGEPLAVAGFRVGESLAWGRHLYVDDLVTIPEARSKGYGAALLAWLAELARSEDACQLHLDSGTERVDAHRFYKREGLDHTGLHFNRILKVGGRSTRA